MQRVHAASGWMGGWMDGRVDNVLGVPASLRGFVQN